MISNSQQKAVNSKINVQAANINRFITLATALLIGLFVIGQFAYFFLPDFLGRDLFNEEFNLNGEGNFPALFSSVLLLICAFLLYLTARIEEKRDSRQAKYWFWLSVIFLYLSIDENISLHEHGGLLFKEAGDLSNFLYYSWIVPAIVALAVLGSVFLQFIRDLPSSTRRQFLIAAIIYIGGAVGIESIAGNHDSMYGQDNITYALLVLIEESFEMFGLVIFVNALIKYIIRSKIKCIEINLLFKDENK